MADNRGSVGEITVSVNVDAEEAITALKAIQREAKKATQALRELSNYRECIHKEITVECNHSKEFNDIVKSLDLQKMRR